MIILLFSGFASIKGIKINEPIKGNAPVSFMVVRDKGTAGVVSVTWEILAHGYNSNKNNDITPARAQIGFLTGESRQNIIVNILADAVPEIDEVHFFS